MVTRLIALLLLALPCYGQIAFTYTDQPFLSGGAPATPSLRLWLDAGVGVTSQGGDNTAIWRWADQSGLGNHVFNLNGSGATNFTGGPTYHTTGGPNGQAYITFTSGRLLSDNSLSISQPNTYFFVCRHPFSGTTKFLFDGVDINSRNAYIETAASFIYAGGALQPQFTRINVANFTVVTFIFDNPNGSRVRTNSVDVAPITVPPQINNFPMARIMLGCAQNTTAPWLGDIAEVLAYNALLTTNECVTVENYLKTKYGL